MNCYYAVENVLIFPTRMCVCNRRERESDTTSGREERERKRRKASKRRRKKRRLCQNLATPPGRKRSPSRSLSSRSLSSRSLLTLSFSASRDLSLSPSFRSRSWRRPCSATRRTRPGGGYVLRRALISAATTTTTPSLSCARLEDASKWSISALSGCMTTPRNGLGHHLDGLCDLDL